MCGLYCRREGDRGDGGLRHGCVKLARREGVWKRMAKIDVIEQELIVDALPEGFSGYRILFLSDLHLGWPDKITGKLTGLVDQLEYDICILGGDYTRQRDMQDRNVLEAVKDIARYLAGRSPVYAVLGNHDRYSIGQMLETCNVRVLVNENTSIQHRGDTIYLAGLDDSHDESDDIELADDGIDAKAFKIMLCHSPRYYQQALDKGYSLLLAGDTHGGQICLPGGYPLYVGPNIERDMVKGVWRKGSMGGYTSRGIGTTRVHVRCFCPAEIAVLTLKRRSVG
jgi:uncharacterized protein